MNERTTPGFAESTIVRFSAPLLLVVALILLNFEISWGLGFALGATTGLVGAYFSWLHLQQLFGRTPVAQPEDSQQPLSPDHSSNRAESDNLEHKQHTRHIQRGAAGGTLAGIALMAVVLAVSAYTPWLNLFATAAGLVVPKWLIALTPFLRRADGRNW